MNVYTAAAAVSLLFCSISCRQGGGTVIARVGDATLTREEALLAVDSTRGETESQLRAYTLSWVNTELLHQEAQKRGIEGSEKFVRQVDDVKRQLAAEALLDEDMLSDTAAISDSALTEYFTAHAPEFFLREDMVKLNMIVFARREEASAFAAAVSQGSSWKSAVDKLPGDAAQTIRLSASEQFYSRRTLTPADLWKVASTLSPGEVSFPVRVGDAFAVLQLLARLGEGRSAEFGFVRDEVAARARIDLRRKRYDDLLASLRGKYKVQVMLPAASASDTTQRLLHE